MNDEKKTKAQLIKELKSLRKQLNVNNVSMPATKSLMKNIKDSKDYLDMIVKASQDGIAILNDDGLIEYGNSALFRILGWPKKEVIKEHFSKFVVEDRLEFITERWKELRAGKGKPHETAILTKKGKRKTLSVVNKDTIIDGQKKYCVVVNDITESKKNELALEESEKKYRNLVGNMPSAVWNSDEDKSNYYLSPKIKEICGFTNTEIYKGGNDLWHSRIHPDDLETVVKAHKSMSPSNMPFYIEYRLQHKNGKWIWIGDEVNTCLDAGGKRSFYGTLSNITDRVQKGETLRKSQQNLKMLMDNTPAVIYRTINDGYATVDFVSKQVKQLTGYPASDFLSGKIKWSKLVVPEDVPKIEKVLAGVSSKNKKYSVEYRIKTSTGKVKWVMEKNFGVYNKSGKLEYVEGFATDITDSKNVQLALRQSETKYKTLYETSQDAITIVDPEQGFISANPTAIKLFGFKNERDILFKTADVVSPQFQPDGELSDIKIERMVENAFKNGSHIFEWQHKRLDGSEFLGTVLFTVMEQDGKRLLLATTRDITEQKKAQEAIKNLLDFENLITEVSTSFINLPVERTDTGINIALGILSKFLKVDRSSVVLFSDDLSITNTVYEWCGKGMASRREQIKEFSTENFRWWITMLKKGNPVYMHSLDEFPKSAADEKELFAAMNVKSYVTVPLFFNKELIGFMNFYSIKTTKVWEEETISLLKIVAEIFVNTIMRSHSQRELREYDAKMFRTEQLASLGIISANIAHELNQPLTVIQLLLQQVKRALTKKPGDIAVVEENINDSLSELTRAAEIVARFRTFARQSSPGSIEMIDVCRIAESLVKALSSGARKTVLKLSLKKPRKAVYVRATAADIEQIFFVLIENSIQAANPKVKNFLDINISCKKNNILIDFQDNCGGVAQELVSKIFDPFFTTKPRQEGTGLGLPILKRIVKRYEGGVKYENHSGHGIIFHISLPMSK